MIGHKNWRGSGKTKNNLRRISLRGVKVGVSAMSGGHFMGASLFPIIPLAGGAPTVTWRQEDVDENNEGPRGGFPVQTEASGERHTSESLL